MIIFQEKMGVMISLQVPEQIILTEAGAQIILTVELVLIL